MKGKLLIIGDMKVDGEYLTGAFIQCTEEQLKANVELYCAEVNVSLNFDEWLAEYEKVHGKIKYNLVEFARKAIEGIK